MTARMITADTTDHHKRSEVGCDPIRVHGWDRLPPQTSVPCEERSCCDLNC